MKYNQFYDQYILFLSVQLVPAEIQVAENNAEKKKRDGKKGGVATLGTNLFDKKQSLLKTRSRPEAGIPFLSIPLPIGDSCDQSGFAEVRIWRRSEASWGKYFS